MLSHKSKINPICTHTGVLPAYPSEHVLFTVTNGAGKLRMVQRACWLRDMDCRRTIQSSGLPRRNWNVITQAWTTL